MVRTHGDLTPLPEPSRNEPSEAQGGLRLDPTPGLGVEGLAKALARPWGGLSGSQSPEPDQMGCTGGLGGGVAGPGLGVSQTRRVTLGKSHPRPSVSSFAK